MSKDISLYEKKYPEKWVVMQNTITQAFREMSIDEKRLVILSSPIVRLSKATEKTPIEILASDFASFAEIDTKSAYKQMKKASKKLMKRTFIYADTDGIETEVQWIIRSKYVDGYVTVFFTDEVIELLKIFDSLNPYTKYLKEDILSLKLTYSIDLYHLAKKYEKMGGFTMSLDDYRQELGTPKSYKRINNLKENAVDSPINEINKKTDIEVSYENVKRGKEVIALKFTVKAKPKVKIIDVKKNDEDRDIKKLTDGQIALFLDAFVNDPTISGLAPTGMSMPAYKSHVRTQLHSNDYLQKHKKILFKAGLIPSYT